MPTKSSPKRKSAPAKRSKAQSTVQKEPEQAPPPAPEIDWQKFLVDYISNAVRASEGPTGRNQAAVTLESLQKRAKLEDAIKNLSHWQIVDALLTATYVRTSLLQAADWLSSVTILDDGIRIHLMCSSSDWPIPLLELLAQTSRFHVYYQELEWYGSPEEQNRILRGLVSGPIRTDGHSSNLYRMLYHMFCGTSVLTSKLDLDDDEKAPIMQGIISMGKKGVFLSDFETFLPKQNQE